MPNITCYIDDSQVFTKDGITAEQNIVTLPVSRSYGVNVEYSVYYNFREIINTFSNRVVRVDLDPVYVTVSVYSYTVFLGTYTNSNGNLQYSDTEWYFTPVTYNSIVKVTFNWDGGTVSHTPYDYQYIESGVFGNGFELWFPTISKPGYEFLGFTGPWNGYGQIGGYKTIDGRSTVKEIKAIYKTYYSYEFELNGGIKTSGSDASTILTKGDIVILPIATKSGYYFSKYTTTPNIGIESIEWLPYYSYNFELNGGLKTTGTDASTILKSGDVIILPTATKSGYFLVNIQLHLILVQKILWVGQ